MIIHESFVNAIENDLVKRAQSARRPLSDLERNRGNLTSWPCELRNAAFPPLRDIWINELIQCMPKECFVFY